MVRPYADTDPDGGVKMFVTPCNYGQTGTKGSCTGSATSVVWSHTETVATYVDNTNTGKANTLALHNDDGNADEPYTAADDCLNLTQNGHSDWYLPAKGEFTTMATNYSAIWFTSSDALQSSTENSSNNTTRWSVQMNTGVAYGDNKTTGHHKRCTRHN